jgi:hypothetical protein
MYHNVKSFVKSCSSYSDYFITSCSSYSDYLNYTIVLRQGCVMSKILFSFFVWELELYLLDKIETENVILILLLFTDDMAIVGKSPIELHNNLDLLYIHNVILGVSRLLLLKLK